MNAKQTVRVVTASFLAALSASRASAVLPVGSEFQVNSYTSGAQGTPVVAGADAGNFAVAWTGDGDGSAGGIFAQRYDSLGVPVGSEFQVNTHTPGSQDNPSIAMNGGGNSVVVWESAGQDGELEGIFGQRYDSAGDPLGTEFIVNTFTGYDQALPDVGIDAAGDFVVVWGTYVVHDADDDYWGIAAQRFDSSGNRVGTESQINTEIYDIQKRPAVAVDPHYGRFVVVWDSLYGDGSGYGIFGRRFDSAGSALGTEFMVNTSTAYNQIDPSIDIAADGSFVVSFNADYTSNVVARRFTSSGQAEGPQFSVDAGFFRYRSAVASHPNGDFVVSWQYSSRYPLDPGFYVADGFGSAIRALRYRAAGGQDGAAFQVNTYTAGYLDGGLGLSQVTPSVDFTANGQFVVTWASAQDGDNYGVFAQRYLAGDEIVSESVAGCPCTVTTDSESDGAATNDQIETTVITPNGGEVTIVDGGVATSNYKLLYHDVHISAPPATAGNPLRLIFEFDLLPEFTPVWNYLVAQGNYIYRNGIAVPDCFAPGVAEPDPCVESSIVQPDGDPVITVLSSSASIWTVGLPCPVNVDASCTAGFEKGFLLASAQPGKEKLIAKFLKGPAMAQTDMGNPLANGTDTAFSLCVYDQAGDLAGTALVNRAADTCSGAACWKALGGEPPAGKGYAYKDELGDAHGIVKLLYKGGDTGKSKAIVKGRGANVPSGIAGALQSSSSATMQLRSGDGGCLSVTLDEVLKQDPDFFKAK